MPKIEWINGRCIITFANAEERMDFDRRMFALSQETFLGPFEADPTALVALGYEVPPKPPEEDQPPAAPGSAEPLPEEENEEGQNDER